MWRNWQTRTFEGRVISIIWVQVPSSAPKQYNPNLIFLIEDGFGLFVYFDRYENTYFPNGVIKRPTSQPIENEVARNMYEGAELDYLIYNAPLEHADLIMNGDPETYMKTGTEYKPLD